MNAYGMIFTRVRAELVDGWGGQRIRDWDNAQRQQAAGNVLAVTVRENTTDREVITTDKRLHTALELTETDRIEWDGKTYELTGVEPFYMLGKFDHVEATMSLTTEPAT